MAFYNGVPHLYFVLAAGDGKLTEYAVPDSKVRLQFCVEKVKSREGG